MSRSSAPAASYGHPWHQSIAASKRNDPVGPMPNDENERRIVRLESLLLGGLYWPVDQVEQALAPREGYTIRVLDVGSDIGVWAVEMARRFPHVEILAVDRSPTRPSDTPSNCRFETLDPAIDDMTHLEGVFDVVHCRRSARRTRYYKSLINKVVKTLKPGGLYLHYEGDMAIYDENYQVIEPAQPGEEPGNGAHFARLLHEVRRGVPTVVDMPIERWGDAVQKVLEEKSGLEGLMRRTIYAPIGSFGSDKDTDLPNREEIGQIMNVSHVERARTWGPALISEGMPAETVARYLEEARVDILKLGAKRYGAFHFFIARVKLHD